MNNNEKISLACVVLKEIGAALCGRFIHNIASKGTFMKNKLAGFALAIASVFGTVAQATPVTITLDDFDQGDQFVAGTAAGASDTNAYRTISMKLLNTVPPVNSTVAVTNGFLDITNGSLDDSVVTVSWNLASALLPANATDIRFLFNVIWADENGIDIDFLLNNLGIASFLIPGKTTNEELSFALNSGVLDPGGELSMVINGGMSWDATLDFVGITYDVPGSDLPEPASLPLAALGLVAAGYVRQRKKTA